MAQPPTRNWPPPGRRQVAAGDAAWYAARDAARAAAWDAARDAAWDAARAAALPPPDRRPGRRQGRRQGAAWDAARDAAWDAARDAQASEVETRLRLHRCGPGPYQTPARRAGASMTAAFIGQPAACRRSPTALCSPCATRPTPTGCARSARAPSWCAGSQQRAGCIERYTAPRGRWQTTALNLVSAALIGALLACGLVYGWSDERSDVPVPVVGK